MRKVKLRLIKVSESGYYLEQYAIVLVFEVRYENARLNEQNCLYSIPFNKDMPEYIGYQRLMY
uniref:Uncharacterized protein n=1 Tax=Anguilla anguilla TaxID=7936 RepID=A0A0E9QFY8_ANGAN